MYTLFSFKLTFTTLMFIYQSIAFLNVKGLIYFKIAIPVKNPSIFKIFTVNKFLRRYHKNNSCTYETFTAPLLLITRNSFLVKNNTKTINVMK